jgi:polysaccharide export outer membrane protein
LLWSAGATSAEYRLAAGDVIEMSVEGQPELRQRALVQIDGSISAPVIGTVPAVGRTTSDLRATVETILATKVLRRRTSDGRDYVVMIQPGDVAVTVVEYRPVYVSGDVLTPGQHAFRPGMTVRQVLALSGGVSPVRKFDQRVDPVDLQYDYTAAATELAKNMVHASRLKAELDDKGEFDIEGIKAVPVPAPILSELARTELGLLKLSRDSFRQEKAYLQRAVQQADAQIDFLSAQERQEESGVQADSGELERVSKAYDSGSLPSPRVAESRRAVLLSSTRRLQTSVNLIETKRQRDELGWKLDRLDSDRKTKLLSDIQDTDVRLTVLRAKLDELAAKRQSAGRVGFIPMTGSGASPSISIVRRDEHDTSRINADADTELQPGDVVEVALPSDPAAGPIGN